MRVTNLKKSREIVSELEARFLDGEKLTIDQIIKDKFNEPTTVISHLQAQAQVRSWLNALKQRFTKIHRLWFGNLNDLNQYGICQTEAEYRYVLTRYYNLAKGILSRTVQVKNEASNAGLLVGEEIIRLPALNKSAQLEG